MIAVDRLSLLQMARDRLVAEIRTAEGTGLAATVRELRAVLAEIENIPGSGEVTPLDGIADGIADDLAARRRAREAG